MDMLSYYRATVKFMKDGFVSDLIRNVRGTLHVVGESWNPVWYEGNAGLAGALDFGPVYSAFLSVGIDLINLKNLVISELTSAEQVGLMALQLVRLGGRLENNPADR